MRRSKVVISTIIAGIMSMSVLTGCGGGSKANENVGTEKANEDGIKTYTAFYAVPGKELPDDNRIKNVIAEKIGAKVDEQWLTGQTAQERIGVMIAGGEYPDFIDGGDATQNLIDAGALIPLDEHLDKYPNLKNYLSEKEWDKVRSEDGHIYIIPQFGVTQGEDTATNFNDEAFWIQKAVLEWDNYPEIKTLDQYFDLIERYKEANPTINGNPTIGLEILTYDWRYFCLENPPQFIAGYPNDGSAIVDPETLEAKNYNTIPEAKEYYKKLNEMYNKGILDPESFTNSYDQYIAKLSTGTVLGMVDQHWQFQSAETALIQQGLDERTWVPLGLVVDESVQPKYRAVTALNVSNGIGVSVSCKDVDGALQFLNDLLDEEIMKLRSWGEEGVDYEVGEDGVFYRTEEQRANPKNEEWKLKNMCDYAYLPHFRGTLKDNINAIEPGDQPKEYYATLNDIDKKILDAYGYEKFPDFLGETFEDVGPWYPIYSFTNLLSADSEAGIAMQKMDDIKRQWLPKVIMAKDGEFEASWDKYMNELTTKANIEAYEKALTDEVKRRVEEFEN